MRITIDAEAPAPVYRQIVSQLRRAIAGGEVGPGDPLPTVRGLAEELGVNFNTVANAYRTLAEEGLVETQQGRGARVIASSKPEADEAAAREALNAFLTEMVLAGKNDAEIVEMVTDALAAMRHSRTVLTEGEQQDRTDRTC